MTHPCEKRGWVVHLPPTSFSIPFKAGNEIRGRRPCAAHIRMSAKLRTYRRHCYRNETQPVFPMDDQPRLRSSRGHCHIYRQLFFRRQCHDRDSDRSRPPSVRGASQIHRWQPALLPPRNDGRARERNSCTTKSASIPFGNRDRAAIKLKPAGAPFTRMRYGKSTPGSLHQGLNPSHCSARFFVEASTPRRPCGFSSHSPNADTSCTYSGQKVLDDVCVAVIGQLEFDIHIGLPLGTL